MVVGTLSLRRFFYIAHISFQSSVSHSPIRSEIRVNVICRINSTLTKARIPRQPYVRPSLDAADEPIDEELEFEKFKMRTRTGMAKIVEFHEAAAPALAEISLSIEMYKTRKQLNNNKEEDAPRVLDHLKRMVQLQKEKEEERKAIVKSERARRQSDLARRSTLGDVMEVPMSNGAFKTWDFSSEINLPSRFNIQSRHLSLRRS